MSSGNRDQAIECIGTFGNGGKPPPVLFINPEDDFYADLKFGPTRLDVPEDYFVYPYLTGEARYYYLPGFLKLAILSGTDASALVERILMDLTEPDMLQAEDRVAIWSLLMNCSAKERLCLSVCIPILEDINRSEFVSPEDEWEAEHRARVWGKSLGSP